MPQVCASPSPNFSVRNGIRISAYQPVSADARADVPDAVPVRVVLAPLVRHLRVPLRAGRIDGELVAVALVVEGVDDDPEAVARWRC